MINRKSIFLFFCGVFLLFGLILLAYFILLHFGGEDLENSIDSLWGSFKKILLKNGLFYSTGFCTSGCSFTNFSRSLGGATWCLDSLFFLCFVLDRQSFLDLLAGPGTCPVRPAKASKQNQIQTPQNSPP